MLYELKHYRDYFKGNCPTKDELEKFRLEVERLTVWVRGLSLQAGALREQSHDTSTEEFLDSIVKRINKKQIKGL
jgi:hypothetical protein